MPVVLFDSGSTFHVKWAAQFVAADPQNRKSVGISSALGAEGVRNAIVQAANHVTSDREIVFAVGHGGSTRMDEGTVDLAPAKQFRLARGGGIGIYVDPFYDFVFPHDGVVPQSQKRFDEADVATRSQSALGARARLQHWAVYASIGTAMRANNIYRVTFLTCRVGNALDFIRKISLDWHTLVKAYLRYVVYQVEGSSGKVRAYLEGDDAGKGTNVPLGETQLPQQDFVTVGPPPGTP